MHSHSHHRPSLFVIVLLALLALMLFARPAHSGWSADPVQVHATSALCPLVATIDDGHAGAIVVWQENTAAGGLLKARHVLASGDLDPASSTPAAVSSQDVARVALGIVSDGNGGAYVWWLENAQLMLTRLTGSGAVAPGWVARGRNLGTLYSSAHRPIAVADGAGGLYIGWMNAAALGGPTANVRVLHLGASGAAAGGWPAAGRVFGLIGTDPTVVSFGLDRARDGGLWFGWQTVERIVAGVYGPGSLSVVRLTPAGAPASGWSNLGTVLASHHPLAGYLTVPAQQVAVAADGADGVFVVASDSEGDYTNGFVFHNTLWRVDGAGSSFAGWGPAGVSVGDLFASGVVIVDEPASLRALADGRGGVHVGLPWFASEFTAIMVFTRFDPAGLSISAGLGTDQRGLEYAARGDGGLFIASSKPSGASGPYEADAYISLAQTDGAAFFESKRSFLDIRYGDIGLTATRDGGAIFAWSQRIDRQGVYVVRLGPAGVVTGVSPTVGAASLRLRFVRGQGVHAVPNLPGATHATLSLHDLAGRTVSQLESDATLGADVVFPGTRSLPGGVYFARASDGTHELHARVVVVR